MYSYSAYGLGICSQFELAHLPVMETEPNVSIHSGVIEVGVDQPLLPSPFLRFDPQIVVFHIPKVARYSVQSGKEITVDSEEGADPGLVQEYLLGAAFAILLHQRGRLVLHASAVNIGGSAVAFLGASGAGKSTTAFAFMVRGHPLLVDDLAAIEIMQGSAFINSGFPRLKLSPEASSVLSEGTTGLEYVGFFDDKHSYRISHGLPSMPLPVKRVYVVVEGSEIEIERLSTQQAVIELVRYTLLSSMIQLDRASHFTRCVKLAELVEFYRLKRPRELNMLSQVAARVEDHLR